MSAHNKLSPRKWEAIEALLVQQNVSEAARVVGIRAQTLARWKEDPAFDCEYRAARRAQVRQVKARVRQRATGAAVSVVDVMQNGKTPAVRLKAALILIRLVEDGSELEDFAAGVAQAARLTRASKSGQTGERSGSRMRGGHGAKLPRRKEQAIAGLLAERSVAEAARAARIGTQTLYRWLQDPGFDTEYRAAARAVFGPALMLLQNRYCVAQMIVSNFGMDRTIPETTRLQAAQYGLEELETNEKEELGADVAELETEPEAGDEPQGAYRTMGKSLHQRLARLKAGLLQAGGQPGNRLILVHAVDGRATGTSETGPEGWPVWLDPPEGCKKGEAVREEVAA